MSDERGDVFGASVEQLEEEPVCIQIPSCSLALPALDSPSSPAREVTLGATNLHAGAYVEAESMPGDASCGEAMGEAQGTAPGGVQYAGDVQYAGGEQYAGDVQLATEVPGGPECALEAATFAQSETFPISELHLEGSLRHTPLGAFDPASAFVSPSASAPLQHAFLAQDDHAPRIAAHFSPTFLLYNSLYSVLAEKEKAR